MESPEEFVASLQQYLEDGEWRAAAECLAPEVLKRFKEAAAFRYGPRPSMTVEAYLERDPDMPRSVAEYRVEQESRYPPREVGEYFAGFQAWDDIEETEDVDLYARHLEAVDLRERQIRYLRMLRKEYPEYADQLIEKEEETREERWWVRREVLGVVARSRRAYVLIGNGASQAEDCKAEEPPEVWVLCRTERGWRLGQALPDYQDLFLAGIEVVDEDGDPVRLPR